uniref:Uncharacterized protein n=1 Tax=Rhodnius prolixus TaxID=13249 RepID=T1HLK3_RHOPR
MSNAASVAHTTNDTSVYAISDSGEEAAKEMVSLMESLVREGCKDNLKITFNLPPKLTKRINNQKMKIHIPFYHAEKLMEKIASYKIIRISNAPLNSHSDELVSIDYINEKTIKSVATNNKEIESIYIDFKNSQEEYNLVNYCLFMGNQLDNLALCLKKMTDLVETNKEFITENEVNTTIYCTKSKTNDAIKENYFTKKLEKSKTYFSKNDDYTTMLQELNEDFKSIVPILENSRECAVELQKLVVKCKTIVNRVGTKLISNETVTIGLQTDEIKSNLLDSVLQVQQHSVDKLSIKQSFEKNNFEEKKIIDETKENIVNTDKGEVYVQSEAAYVLLPKEYTIQKTGKKVGEEFDLYVLQKSHNQNKENLAYETERIVENHDRDSTSMKPLLSQPMVSDEEEDKVSEVSNLTNSVEEIIERNILTVMQDKPSIANDDNISGADLLSLAAGKSNIDNFTLPLTSNIPYTLKDCYKHLKKMENISNNSTEFLGNYAYITQLIGERKKKEFIAHSIKLECNQETEQNIGTDVSNQQNETTIIPLQGNAVSKANDETDKTITTSEVSMDEAYVKEGAKVKRKRKWKLCRVS